MKTKPNSSTIVAQATAPGSAAISIVRLSGPQAYSIAQKIWQPAISKKVAPRELSLGWLVEGDNKLDQAMLVYMPAPHSYTGEDVVEIHLHGAPIITQKTIQLSLQAGAVLAQPGEYTKRAFLAGKIDLVQAEAVAELIASSNATMMRLASKQLAGGLSSTIQAIKSKLLSLAAHNAALLDFSEEDIADTSTASQQENISNLIDQTKDLLNNSKNLAVVRDGYSIALVGLPNAGKSTLLNHLLGFERSIVTDIAGTTRDTITESIQLSDITIHITDTAGLRQSEDKVEQLGVDRTKQELQNSDSILVLVEPGKSQATYDYLKKQNILKLLNPKTSLVVNTKIDTTTPSSIKELADIKHISISAKTGDGITGLKQEISSVARQNQSSETLSVLTSRQIELIKSLKNQLEIIQNLLTHTTPPDIVLVEYQKALTICSSITGEEVTQEIIDEVFANFCIGK